MQNFKRGKLIKSWLNENFRNMKVVFFSSFKAINDAIINLVTNFVLSLFAEQRRKFGCV